MPRHMFGKKIDESKWEAAKKQAASEGKSGNYAYITSIYKKMAHVEKAKLAEQEAIIGRRMKKKSIKAERLSRQSRQDKINNETLEQMGVPQATMLKASELLAKLQSKGKSKNRSDSDFDSEQLRMGTAVEMEHGLGKEAAKEIAKDHLAEMSDYYTRLKKMEAKKSLEHALAVLVKSKYLSRKKVKGKWVYKYKYNRKKGKKPLTIHVPEKERARTTKWLNEAH